MKAYWIKISYKIGDNTRTREFNIDASSIKYARNKIIRKMASEIKYNKIKVSTIKVIDSSVIGYY